MGCCYSSDTDTTEQDADENKPLITSANHEKSSNGMEQNSVSVPSTRTDEQALLTSILTKTAMNIIDVSAADSVGMEQHEYMDKARQYSTRLVVLSCIVPRRKFLPSLTSQPHQVLASDLVPYSDVEQVSKIAAYACSATSQIKVDTKEELVVQFAIP